MFQPGDQFVLPDLYAVLPFEGGQNPLFDVVCKESRDWIDSYDILPHHLRAGFTSGEVLASYCYPYAPHDAFRICADFINILLTLDEVSDVQDSDGARETIHLFVRTLRDDPDCDDGTPLAKMLIEYVICDCFPVLIPYELPRTNLYFKLCEKVQEDRDPELSTPLLSSKRYLYGGREKGG